MQLLKTNELSYQHNLSFFQLKNISIHIKEGEIVSLIGPNGSGKSTLLRTISRLCKPYTGEIYLTGKNIQQMKSQEVAKKLAMLPQMNSHQLDFTVRELVEYGRHPHLGKRNSLSDEDKQIVNWAIEVTGLATMQNRMLSTMSGGERQRAWIAMTVAQNPKVLLLDEPTTYLDISHQLEVMELVKELNEKFQMTVVMVLHDINQAAKYSDRLIVLKDGTIKFDGIPQCIMCKEMFQSVFEIDAEIFLQNGVPFFNPIKRFHNQGAV